MKTNIIALSALLLTLTTSQLSFAQKNPKNTVKLNVPGLVVGAINVQYERVLSPKVSAVLGVSYFIPASSRVLKGISTSEFKVNKNTMSGFGVMPEIRFYLSGKSEAPRGFYIAPYGRFSRKTIDLDVNATVDFITKGKDIDTKFVGSGSFTTFGGGILIGAQWIFPNNLTLDWWILGLGVTSTKFDVTSNGDYSDLDLSGIDSSVQDSGFPIKLTTKTSPTQLNAEGSILLPDFRMGIAFGYAF